MAGWASWLHKRLRDIKSRAVTELWYKMMFYRMGPHCAIVSPLYMHKPEFVEIGAGVSIGPYCRLETHPAPVRNKTPKPILKIGDRVRIGHGVILTCQKSLIIGDNVLIAGGCYVSDNNHSIDPEGPRYLDQPLSSKDTVIGKGAWLGQNVCILAGSTIGERSVIGAGSVVNGAIPPYSIAVGNPARVVKQYDFEAKKWQRVPLEEGRTLVSKGG